MYKFIKIISFLFFVLNISISAQAEQLENNSQKNKTAYITDDLTIFIHSGPGTQYRIIGTITAGSQIQLTGQQRNDFSEIIDEKGRHAWLKTQYVSPKLGLRFAVAELNAQLSDVQENNATLSAQLAQATSEIDNLRAKNAEIANQLAQTQKTLLSTQKQLGEQDGEIKKQWFFNGAIVLGIGLLLGIILPRLSVKRKSSMESWK